PLRMAKRTAPARQRAALCEGGVPGDGLDGEERRCGGGHAAHRERRGRHVLRRGLCCRTIVLVVLLAGQTRSGSRRKAGSMLQPFEKRTMSPGLPRDQFFPLGCY